ncbi:MAG TPA: ATP-binding protein [Anaeromyxobacteraceae bacterium]|nr:ATP-binding protein [Anaeromyxobacteraceae bacterium]
MSGALEALARPRVRLWMKLAALAALGVVIMHAAHLAIARRVGSRALGDEQARLGKSVARLVARQAVDPLILGDLVTLHEVVQGAVADRSSGVAYCFVVRDGAVVASSFGGATPPDLVAARPPGELAPLVVRSGKRRVLDVAEPLLGGELGAVRVGLEMDLAAVARRDLASRLGLLALGLIAVGVVAAFLVGRGIARPVGQLLDAADRFDPARGVEVPEVRPRGSDEVAVLTGRFNRMMRRLAAAHAEQERTRQKAVETERLAALGSLVAGVAHEVNNPLAGLKNCVRRLERAELPEGKRREYLALMEDGLGRIEEVVRQLLDFGRPHPTVLEPTSAAALARDAARLVGPLLHQRRVACSLPVRGEAARVLADRGRAGQALVNLILNAAWVTPEGGEIRVRLRRRPGLVGLAVEDDGPGIPKEIRERVLDPFFTTKPEGEGTGLGLPVTRTIVDAHGGELAFEFPEAGGTVVTVWLHEAATPEGRAAG